jgi:amidophosphoribosyltransferase
MCGIIGIYGNQEAARIAALGMFAEQHRGQESCGLAVSDGK